LKMNTITIDLGGTIIKAGLFNGERLVESVSAKATSGKGLKNNLPVIEKMIVRLLENYKVTVKEILGIGFSFPGLVDSARNRVLSTNKKYHDAPDLDLPRWAKETWNLPLYMENDARMALLGEWQQGAGKGIENIVMITLGTGIGSAVLIEGKLLRGKHYQAGNLGGHFTVNHRGTVCTCGNIGCIEAEASTWRLPELIKNHAAYNSSSLKNAKLLDYEALFRNAAQNDFLANEILEHCFSVWSSGLISMIHAYDPEIIILSGGIMKSAQVILPVLQKRVDKYAWTPWGKVKLLKAENINTAALYGADYLVRFKVYK
jgi:glucokinase